MTTEVVETNFEGDAWGDDERGILYGTNHVGYRRVDMLCEKDFFLYIIYVLHTANKCHELIPICIIN